MVEKIFLFPHVDAFHCCSTEHASWLFWPYHHLQPSTCPEHSPLFLGILTVVSVLFVHMVCVRGRLIKSQTQLGTVPIDAQHVIRRL